MQVTYTHSSTSFLRRKGRHRVWIKDLHPYIFCDDYHARHQLRRHGDFELEFINEKGMSVMMVPFSICVLLTSM